MIKTILILSLSIFSPFILFGQIEEEYILSYDMDIEIHEDRSLLITEFIRVQSRQKQIKRGITRNLFNSRNLGNHGHQNMKYDIKYVRKDNMDEPYHIQSNGNNQTIYIGSRDIILDNGIYDYTIQYAIEDQIAFFEKYDEFYWNAIGHQNTFKVEKASIDIVLPEAINIIRSDAFTGEYGEQKRSFTKEINDNIIRFTISEPLEANEGVTVAIGMKPGIIKPPSFWEKFSLAIFFTTTSFFLLLYYFITWFIYGKDPKTPKVFEQFDSPMGLSPAALSYIQFESTKSNSITASLVDLANIGFIHIQAEKSQRSSHQNNFRLIKLKDEIEQLPIEQQSLIEKLFLYETKEVLIKGEYHPYITTAIQEHHKALKSKFQSFINKGNNITFSLIPLFVTIIGIVLFLYLENNMVYNDLIPIWLVIPFMIIAIISFFIYLVLIKKPSLEKVKLRAKIKAFKAYIEMSEEEKHKILDAPMRTIEHYERLLPFAIALNAEKTWNKQFSSLLEDSSYYQDPNRQFLNPNIHFHREFNNALAKTTTAPSPTGNGFGSAGGGFSGGGGGGGGVGGW